MKKSFTLAAVIFTTFILTSSTLSAQITAVGAQQGLTTFAGLITTFNNTVVKALGTLFLSGAVVAFFFGVAKFIWGLREGKSDAITNGKQFMIWSLVGLFVMFSVYGIIKVAQSLVPGLNSSSISIPDVNYGGNGGNGLGTPSNIPNSSNPLGTPSSVPNSNGSSLGTPSNINTPGANMGNNSLYAPQINNSSLGTPSNINTPGANMGNDSLYAPYTGGNTDQPSDLPSDNCTVEQGC